jgi:hypothetical protein
MASGNGRPARNSHVHDVPPGAARLNHGTSAQSEPNAARHRQTEERTPEARGADLTGAGRGRGDEGGGRGRVAHLAAHAAADAVGLLVHVVAGLRHRGDRTANPHAGADEGAEGWRTSEIPLIISRAGAAPMARRRAGSPRRSPHRGGAALRRLGTLGFLGICHSPLQPGLGSGRGED